jgi:hypothetical protein
MLQILRGLASHGQDVFFGYRDTHISEGARATIGELPSVTFAPLSDLEDIEPLLKHEAFAAVLLTHWDWCNISVAEAVLSTANCRAVAPYGVIADDLHFFRERRCGAVSGLFDIYRIRARTYYARDLGVLRNADFAIVNREDYQRWLREETCKPVMYYPPTVPAEPPLAEQGGPKFDMLFVGDLDHEANFRSLMAFVKGPYAKSLADRGLLVAGNCSSTEKVALLRKFGGITVDPNPARTDEAFSLGRVFINPVLYGSGIKIKNLFALQRGLPIVTTPVGAEGIRGAAMTVVDLGSFPSAIIECLSNTTKTTLPDEYSATRNAEYAGRLLSLARDAERPSVSPLSGFVQKYLKIDPSLAFKDKTIENSKELLTRLCGRPLDYDSVEVLLASLDEILDVSFLIDVIENYAWAHMEFENDLPRLKALAMQGIDDPWASVTDGGNFARRSSGTGAESA